jgi:hypothetical protein
MQLGSVERIDTAYSLLDNYFNTEFGNLKQGDKRHGKRRQHFADPLGSPDGVKPQEGGNVRAAIQPIQNESPNGLKTSSSALLSPAPVSVASTKTGAGASPAPRGAALGPRPSLMSPVASSPTTKAAAPSNRGGLHVEDYHRVSDLIHRITNLSGVEPGQVRLTRTPDSLLEKAERMAELQLKEMKYSDRLKNILSDVIQVHLKLKELAPALQGHRKDWGDAAADCNKQYLALFESMMAEILLIHRKKFRVSAPVALTYTVCEMNANTFIPLLLVLSCCAAAAAADASTCPHAVPDQGPRG